MYSTHLVELAAQRCSALLAGAGLSIAAKVRDSAGVIDLALIGLRDQSVVIRCVARPTDKDCDALRIMLVQGDFDRAALVYSTGDQRHRSHDIETYPISRVDELVASLAKDRAP